MYIQFISYSSLLDIPNINAIRANVLQGKKVPNTKLTGIPKARNRLYRVPSDPLRDDGDTSPQ